MNIRKSSKIYNYLTLVDCIYLSYKYYLSLTPKVNTLLLPERFTVI